MRADRDRRMSRVMTRQELFLAQLPLIERAIAFVCRRNRLVGADADDFASHVKLKLIEDDYAILNRFEGRCRIETYITVCVQRLLLDQRVKAWGKWHASAAATRLGEAAIALEKLLHRDGRSLDEAIPLLAKSHQLDSEGIRQLAAQLPERKARARAFNVDLDDSEAEAAMTTDASDTTESTVVEFDRLATSRKLAQVMRGALAGLAEDDRSILMLRFVSGLSIVDISRSLQMEAKPLYRRIERLMGELRRGLEGAGLRAADVDEIIGRPTTDLDFGFREGKIDNRPSILAEGAGEENAPQ